MTAHPGSGTPVWVPLHLTPGSLVAREPWRLRAACWGHELPPSTWDDAPGVDGRESPKVRNARVEKAKAVCRGCEVRAECLRDVDWERDEGVRGGEDLRKLRQARKREAS